MEHLYNGFTLEICEGGFPLSTDSIALSGFVKLPRGAQVLDLGSGCGTLGLLLCARWDDCTVTGMELDENAHRTALQNIDANHLTGRLSSICADLCGIPSMIPAGSYTCCVSNPPYFAAGPQSHLPLARREDSCSMESLFVSAAWALKYGGDFFLVHRPERLAQLCSCASRNQMEVKRLLLLRHRQNGPVTLILAQCRKGGKPGLILEEAAMQDENGNPTEYYKELYHL